MDILGPDSLQGHKKVSSVKVANQDWTISKFLLSGQREDLSHELNRVGHEVGFFRPSSVDFKSYIFSTYMS
jgi:hypothetical protein